MEKTLRTNRQATQIRNQVSCHTWYRDIWSRVWQSYAWPPIKISVLDSIRRKNELNYVPQTPRTLSSLHNSVQIIEWIQDVFSISTLWSFAKGWQYSFNLKPIPYSILYLFVLHEHSIQTTINQSTYAIVLIAIDLILIDRGSIPTWTSTSDMEPV